jgi:hypothetical protein
LFRETHNKKGYTMRKYRLFQYTLLAFIFTMFAGSAALAAGPINTWTVDGGGGIVSTGTGAGGSFSLGGSVGQPDAGSGAGGNFTLGGGFWGGGALSSPTGLTDIYLPIIMRN